MRMYDYSLQFLQLEEMLSSGTIDQETFDDTIEALEGSADEKAENVARMIDNFVAQAKVLKEEEDLLKKKRKTLENSVDFLTGNLEVYLKSRGKQEHQVGMYKLRYKKLPPIVEVIDQEEIPEAYLVPQPPKVDKQGLARVLKDGEAVPGVELITGRTKFEVKK